MKEFKYLDMIDLHMLCNTFVLPFNKHRKWRQKAIHEDQYQQLILVDR